MDKEALDKQLPYYLTEGQKTGLKAAISDFNMAKEVNYYQDGHEKDILQGDVWKNFVVLNYHNDLKQDVKGMVLSNSCDISPENERELPPKIIFSPLITLEKYEERLHRAGMNRQAIDSKLQAIRKQEITSIFYLPANPKAEIKECIVTLDNIHSIPSNLITGRDDFEKVNTLSMFGFYMFVFKLSIHFCRLHENVDRK